MPNRLSHEQSPYLQQHANNPVDWYPWGSEALERARREDKPILLSIGYAACHWCHVMAHESFEDEATAAIMNEHFVNIKVDREERPDIDSIYMSAVQAMTGSGGWPLTAFLLPDGRPFFAGTYFPPEAKAAQYGMASFPQVLESISQAFHEQRNEIENAGSELVRHLARLNTTRSSVGSLSRELLDQCYGQLKSEIDPVYGGFGNAPKFPQPMALEFMLRMAVRGKDSDGLGLLAHTLRMMAQGGMYDQVGGGFHRYSVDERWLVPHFEKMLYDNALLADLYTLVYQATGDTFFRAIAEETLDYLLRDMRHPEGGFYSTEDADSEGHEGRFYVWTPEQLRAALGEDATLVGAIYNVTARGNFEGTNILHLPRPLDAVARVMGVPIERIQAVLERSKPKLLTARALRVRPGRDEKILTAWNGMALRAFARAGAAFDRSDYRQTAETLADFLLGALRREDGRLLRSWKNGQASAIPAFLEDYALLADGLLALYETGSNAQRFRSARELADTLLDFFWDEQLGGFYDTAPDHEALIARPRDVSDNATPSGNSAAVEMLLRMGALTGDDRYDTHAERVLEAQGELLERFPSGYGRMLCATDFALTRVQEVALIGSPDDPRTQALRHVIQHAFQPYAVVAWAASEQDSTTANTPLLQDRPMISGAPTAYVCEGFVCRQPVTEPTALREQLDSVL